MLKRLLPIAFVGTFLLFLFNIGCTKLDTTSLGSDLIPVVDNVNTFADTLEIVSTQGFFNDSTVVDSSEYHALGLLNNDPLFGTTDATIYVQMKPTSYPFYFGNPGDTVKTTQGLGTLVGVDSVVVCLAYAGAWGDTIPNQQLDVRQIFDNNFAVNPNTPRTIQYQPAAVGPVLGSANINIAALSKQIYINAGKDSVSNQIRIKITDQAWVDNLYNRDSSRLATTNNAFFSDSLFRQFYNGFAISASSTASKSLLYANLIGATSRIEIYYRKRNGGAVEKTFAAFPVYQYPSAVAPSSATANRIVRTYAGGITAPTNNDQYLQTSDGSYTMLKVNSLDTLTNRIIHRAQILVEGNADNPVTDSLLTGPNYLYLDLLDEPASANKYKPIYFDLNPASAYDPDNQNGYPYFPNNLVDPTSFGGRRSTITDATGKRVTAYSFNVTRYLQQYVSKNKPNYSFRLFAPFSFKYPQYSTGTIPYFNNIANGRVRLAGGANPIKAKRMKMIVIYSKIR